MVELGSRNVGPPGSVVVRGNAWIGILCVASPILSDHLIAREFCPLFGRCLFDVC
jgi:hypothetical protein